MKRCIYFLIISCWPFISIHAQSCLESITSTTDKHDYKINNNGTMTDRVNEIVWARCALGQSWQNNKCVGKNTQVDWEQARNQANQFNFAGFNDWRLPSNHELSRITELSCQNPAINLELFPGTPSTSFWSGTEFATDNNNAWQVFFGSGENHTAKKSSLAAVRLVRSIKTKSE